MSIIEFNLEVINGASFGHEEGGEKLKEDNEASRSKLSGFLTCRLHAIQRCMSNHTFLQPID